MFSAAAAVLLVLASPIYAALQVSTPRELVQCKPATFAISGSDATPQGSYYGYFVPANTPCGDALVEIEEFSGSSLDWVVNLPVGTTVMLGLENEAGVEGWSGALTVVAGDSTDCLSTTAPSSGSDDFSVNSVPVDTPGNAAEDPNANEASGAGRVALSGAVLAFMGAVSMVLTL